MIYTDIIFKALPDILFNYLPLSFSIISLYFSFSKNKFDKLEKNRNFLLDMQVKIRMLFKCIDDIDNLDVHKDSLDYNQYYDSYIEIRELFDELIKLSFPSEHKLPIYDSSKDNISNAYYQNVYKTAKQIDNDISESINKINIKQFKTIQH